MGLVPQKQKRPNHRMVVPLGGLDKISQETRVEHLIVVHHQDVLGVTLEGPSNADIRPLRKPQITVALHDIDVGKLAADGLAGTIRRAVVDNYNADIQSVAVDPCEASQALQSYFSAVMNRKDYLDRYC